MKVYNVPKLTRNGIFLVYGTTKPNNYVTVTAKVGVEKQSNTYGMIKSAIAENDEITLGVVPTDENGHFEMEVKLPSPAEYLVRFAVDNDTFEEYGVTYDTGATPMPTPQPLPTAVPVEEDNGLGVLPFIIGGVLILVAAGIYGVYVYRRRTEEEDEDEEDEDEEYEMRQEQLERQRQRSAQSARSAQQAAPRAARSAQVPSYMRQPGEEDAPRSPYARPQAPVAPQAPVRPRAPQAPIAPQAPARPQPPTMPKAPVVPQAPEAPAQTGAEGAPRRRRRQQADQD